MFKFLLIALFSFSAYGQGDLSGNLRSQGAPSVANNFGKLQVPNFQATKTGAVDALIETGNKNLLRNPGFEHSTYSAGWTTSGTATYSGTTTTAEVLSGLKSFKAVASAQTVDLIQDTTILAASRVGSQMFFRFVADNTAAGCRAHVRKNGVKQTGSNDSLALATDGVARTYELAFLADGTSNGIEIECTSTTGTLIVDDVELSTDSSSFIDVAQIGPWIDYGVIPLTAVTSNPTKGTTTADKVECRTNGQDYECRYRFANTGTGAAAGSGDYLVGLPTGVELNETFYTAYTGTLSGTSQDTNSAMDTSGGSVQNGTNSGRAQAFYYGTNRFRLFLTAEFASTGAWSSGYKPVTVAQNFFFTVKFRGKGLSNKISTYSQFAVSDVSVENVFSAKVSATGVVSDESLDWISGNCTNATPRVCTFNSGIVTVPMSCTVTATGAGGRIATIISSTSSVISFQNDPSQYDNHIICTKQGVDYKAKNVITGSFQNIEKCADPYECTNVYSAKVNSAGVVSDENLDWVSGNCTSVSGTITCTFNAGLFTVTPNCSYFPYAQSGTTSTFAAIVTQSPTSLQWFQQTTGAGAGLGGHITCSKQGADFKPKTAVAGTYLDAVTSPGAGRPVLCSAKISSTGVISDQIGGCFASCTNATTPVCTFTSNFWRSGTIPNCWGVAVSAAASGTNTTSSTTFSGAILNSANAEISGSRTYFCQGVQ